MFAVRLVQLIEVHADKLSDGLINKLKRSENCNSLLYTVPSHELKHRTFEIYRHLSDWIVTKTEAEIEERYFGMGARSAHQKVPFSQLLFAVQATKEHLWDFLRQEGLLDPEDLIAEMELLHVVELFFDRVLYHAARGFEAEMVERWASEHEQTEIPAGHPIRNSLR